uniref:Uncharacterized protein n=1 Tax=Rhizophora mucronata TaxID=61149 RepID=A0A2P2NIF1_RHIMU
MSPALGSHLAARNLMFLVPRCTCEMHTEWSLAQVEVTAWSQLITFSFFVHGIGGVWEVGKETNKNE